MKKFSERLRHARLERDYTQVDLARRAGLSQSAVASYESGGRQSSRAIFKLATALGVDAQWLNTGEGPMVSPERTSHNTAAYMLRETSAELSSNPASIPSRGWPFLHIPRSHYDNLRPRHKQLLETFVKIIIDACQATEDAPTFKKNTTDEQKP